MVPCILPFAVIGNSDNQILYVVHDRGELGWFLRQQASSIDQVPRSWTLPFKTERYRYSDLVNFSGTYNKCYLQWQFRG
jgi:hypothetical protein